VFSDKLSLPSKDRALSGRDQAMQLENVHFVNGTPIFPPFSADNKSLEVIYFGLGCFWGAERKFWQMDGVHTTAVGYMSGLTPNPTYEEVCTGLTGHNEVVMVVFDPEQVTKTQLLTTFFESHDPTQGMRQGNDRGTQYRSGIYCVDDAQKVEAERVCSLYQSVLSDANRAAITTEILMAPVFYYAEQYHQQYLAKNPNGYCGIGGTGISCPV